MQRDPLPTANLTLKIAALSPQRATLDDIRAALGTVNAHLGGAELLPAAADANPDVLLVDATDLSAIEAVIARHPSVAVILLSPDQSSGFLRQAMRIGIRDVLPLPVSKDALKDSLGRLKQRTGEPRRRGKVLSFIGCKGGSGATFIASNVAYVLAEQEGKKVALIDLNFQFGDAALYVTHRVPTSTLADVAEQIHRLDAELLAAAMLQVLPNFHVLPAPEDPEQALRVPPESIEPLLRLAAAEYDVVIVDAGRSLDDVTVRALDRSDTVYAVLQLNLPFLRDGKRLLRSLASLGYARDKVKLVANRFHKSSPITLQDVRETLGQEVFFTVPNSFDTVTASVNQGVPVLKLAARDAVTRGLRDLVGTLVEKKEAGGWRRLLTR
jgi:pilus assembly protein CpaE